IFRLASTSAKTPYLLRNARAPAPTRQARRLRKILQQSSCVTSFVASPRHQSLPAEMRRRASRRRRHDRRSEKQEDGNRPSSRRSTKPLDVPIEPSRLECLRKKLRFRCHGPPPRLRTGCCRSLPKGKRRLRSPLDQKRTNGLATGR